MTGNDLKVDDLGRFRLVNTVNIRSLLSDVAQHPQTPQDLKELCQQHLKSDAVPWKVLQHAHQHLRQHKDQSAAVHGPAGSICEGSRLLFPSPPVRQRSKQLEERLAKLQHMVEQQEYAAMVEDVTHMEQQAAAAREDPFFPTTKLQLSFGLHVIVTMGTFFALGYYGGKYILRNEAWAVLMGAIGLAAALLLETTLLIMRTNRSAAVDGKYAHLLDKRWDKQTGAAEGQQQQRQQSVVVGGAQQSRQDKRDTSSRREGCVSSRRAKAD